jgi:hypothetical protein
MVSGLLFFRLSTNARTRQESDIWFLSSGNGAAVRASLLPRYQESGIRDQGSEMVPGLLRLRLSANARNGRDLLPGPCFLIPDKG